MDTKNNRFSRNVEKKNNMGQDDRKISGSLIRLFRKNNSQEHLQNKKHDDNRNFGNKSKESYNPDSKYSFQKQLKYRKEHFDANSLVRLNKYLSNAGICARREADKYIQSGAIKVNGVLVTELGKKISRTDIVTFRNLPVRFERRVYLLLNKPKNCITTVNDTKGRHTVMDLVKNACEEQIFPVGRLDRNTTGVLLFTNDGDLINKLIHPKYMKKKVYQVGLDRELSITDMQKLSGGIQLEDGEVRVDDISYVSDKDKTQIGIEIHSGRNRIVRRMFESLGYRIIKLDRVYFAGLTKKNLKRGQWRFLNDREISMLHMGIFN